MVNINYWSIPSYDITSIEDYDRYKKDQQERGKKMPLKIEQTITKEYTVMLYCKETDETKEATLEDLKEFITEQSNYDLTKQINDLNKENTQLTKLTESLSKENLELKHKILALSAKPYYEYMPWDYRKPFEVTCRTEYDTYDFNPGIISEGNSSCCECNCCECNCCDTSLVVEAPTGDKSGFIKYGSDE